MSTHGDRFQTSLGRAARCIVLAAALAGAAACAPMFREHGYVPDDAELAAIVPGVDTRDSVVEQIGPPTAQGLLDSGGIYFVESRFRRFGPFEQQEVDREVVAITFDRAGVVQGIERYGLEDGQVVALSRRVTDDNVRNTTFLRQLFGNLGNFDAGRLFGDDEPPV